MTDLPKVDIIVLDKSLIIMGSDVMKMLKPPKFSMNFNESKAEMKRRFSNILDGQSKKMSIVSIIIVFLIVCVIGGMVVVSKNDRASMREFYMNFAQEYRVDFIPTFDEGVLLGKENVSTDDFLMFVYYVRRNELPESLIMSKELVESTIKEFFGVKSVVHTSLFKTWNYDEENGVYIPVPQGVADKELFDTLSVDTYKSDGKTVYDVVLKSYALPYKFSESDSPSKDVFDSYLEYLESDDKYYDYNVRFLLEQKGEELKFERLNVYDAVRQIILSGKNDENIVGKVIKVRYYLEDEKPVFIYKMEE